MMWDFEEKFVEEIELGFVLLWYHVKIESLRREEEENSHCWALNKDSREKGKIQRFYYYEYIEMSTKYMYLYLLI